MATAGVYHQTLGSQYHFFWFSVWRYNAISLYSISDCCLCLQDAIEVFDPVTNRNIRYETFFPRRTAPYSKPTVEKLQTHWISAGDQETSEVGSDSDDDSEWSDVVERQSSGVADILVTGEVRL